jgi:hypothetical protein
LNDRLGDRALATKIGAPRVKQPGARQIVEAGCPQHRWMRGHDDRQHAARAVGRLLTGAK